MTRAEDYDYVLPPELIAQNAVEPRDHSRLLVLDRKSGKISHHHFHDLPQFLDSNDLLVANNTRVMKARLLGKRVLEGNQSGGGGKIEFLLLEEVAPLVWDGMFHAAAKHRPGVRFEIPTPSGEPLRGELIRGASDSPSGTVAARFDRDPIAAGAGEIPLPPYLERAHQPTAFDEARYQTIYSKEIGSAAAPTAGLHFTDSVRDALRAKGVGWQELTLHVGLGTFRPVKAGELSDHVMHEERYEITESAAREITEAKQGARRVVAVGTTVVRTLESAWQNGALHAGPGRTAVFIYPGGPKQIQVVDRLITNFHLPRSTLLMLVSAFAGKDLVLRAYEEAVREKYRFYSYGDAMLVL